MNERNEKIMNQIKGKLIVSCQALPEEPLHSSFIMGRMAYAAYLGGAGGIRANTVEDIEEIRKNVDLPVIGIIKKVYDDEPHVYITPTMAEVDALVNCGCEIIALDATCRTRPGGVELKEFFSEVRAKYPDQLFMADCASIEDDQKICFSIDCHTCAERIVVTDRDLCRSHRVILIQNGDRTVFQQPEQCVLKIETPVIAVEIITRKQDLRNGVIVFAKQTVIGVHQFALTDRSRGLLAGHVIRPGGETKLSDTHSDGAGRNENDFVAGILQIAEDLHKVFYMADIHSAARMGKCACADFYNNTRHTGHLLFTTLS